MGGAESDALAPARARPGLDVPRTRTAPSRWEPAETTETKSGIDGDTIVAGATGDDVGVNPVRGSVYTFARTGAAARTETAKVTVSDGAR